MQAPADLNAAGAFSQYLKLNTQLQTQLSEQAGTSGQLNLVGTSVALGAPPVDLQKQQTALLQGLTSSPHNAAFLSPHSQMNQGQMTQPQMLQQINLSQQLVAARKADNSIQPLIDLDSLQVPDSYEPQGNVTSSRRRSQQQLEILESVFKLCPNPSESRRRQLGNMLKLDERKVMIWFQNKRQRVKAKMKEQENGALRQQHLSLKTELEREKNREQALEQENALLKAWMESKRKKLDELRKASSQLLVEYYKKKGHDMEDWKACLPAGLEDALKLSDELSDEGKADNDTSPDQNIEKMASASEKASEVPSQKD